MLKSTRLPQCREKNLLNNAFYKLLEREAQAKDLDPDLVVAIASVESNYNSWAVRFEPTWQYFSKPEKYAKKLGITLQTEKILQACSWGAMQTMGAVAREDGFDGPLQQLSLPEVGVQYGCKQLLDMRLKYGDFEDDMISAYNQGSPKKDHKGLYRNQAYVNKVKRILLELRTVK